MQLEHLWDEFATECHVEILCGYAGHGAHDTDHHMFDRICAEHSADSPTLVVRYGSQFLVLVCQAIAAGKVVTGTRA